MFVCWPACGCLGVYVTLNCDCELDIGMNVNLMIFHVFSLDYRAKEKPQTQRKKMTSLRRSTENVRRPGVLPCTLFVLQAHLKGNMRCPVNQIVTYITFYSSQTALLVSFQMC